MASWNTKLYTSQGAVPPAGVSDAVNFPLEKNIRGKLRFAKTIYVWNGNEAANDTINLVLSKSAARIAPEDSHLICYPAANTANLVLNIGDSNNTIRYSNGLTAFANTNANVVLRTNWANCTSPLLTTLFSPNDIALVNQSPGVPYGILTANDQTVLVVTIASVSNVSANAKLLFEVGFVDE